DPSIAATSDPRNRMTAAKKSAPIKAAKTSSPKADKAEDKKKATAGKPAAKAGAADAKRGRKPGKEAEAKKEDLPEEDFADGEAELEGEVEAAEEAEGKAKAKPLRMKVSRAKERALMREFGLDETALTEEEVAKRRQELKTLIKMGKTRGFLTHQEINDHLPEKLVDNEILEAIVSMLNDMGIAVYEQAPDAATLLIAGAGTTTATEEEAEDYVAEEDVDFFDEEDDDDGQGGSKALTKKLEELKTAALTKFDNLRINFDKMRKAFERDGYQSPSYNKAQHAISAELMTVRFTVKTIEKLCAILRSQVDDVRRYERELRKILVDKCGMPQDYFIKHFPPHILSLKWAEKEVALGKAYSVVLARNLPPVQE